MFGKKNILNIDITNINKLLYTIIIIGTIVGLMYYFDVLYMRDICITTLISLFICIISYFISELIMKSIAYFNPNIIKRNYNYDIIKKNIYDSKNYKFYT
tara:strand:+ start:736 stop:1035 length:300 start_codon:yes stop_codon:yes gene_type:complete